MSINKLISFINGVGPSYFIYYVEVRGKINENLSLRIAILGSKLSF